ncbi:uncharacterized protein TNCV_1626071 [Trichonephila clavipes]|nr:uncharacterized protein TNCV_1626071 [Trichonephila clavipes]
MLLELNCFKYSLLLGILNHIGWEIVRHITAKRLPTPVQCIKKRTVYILILALNLEAVVALWSRYRIIAGLVQSLSPVPLKTRSVGQCCTLNLSRAQMSYRWCGVVVRRGGSSSGVVHVT